MTKQAIPPSALDLFRRWHSHFERLEIKMEKIGFSEGGNSDRFFLRPTRNRIPLRYKFGIPNFPYVEVLKARLKGTTAVDTDRGIAPNVQTRDEYWRLIDEQLLRSRKFFVQVYAPHFPSWYNVQLREGGYFSARFRTWPAVGRGLVINPRDQEPWPQLHWSAFIPEGTPEHEAIAAANELAEFANKEGLKPTKEQIGELQEHVFEKLKLVPA